MKRGIIFDLDGTLWDSAENVCRAWNEVFGKRYPQLDRTITVPELHSYMGKTLDEIGLLMFPELDEEQRNRVIQAACENENAFLKIHGGRLFEGVIETLTRLREEYSLYIVSNCQSGYIETFLGFFGIEGLFEDFECPGRTGLPKGENIRLVMERCGIQRAIYVGDTEGDLAAADFAGITFVHAAYGFGKPCRPTERITDFCQLIETAHRLLSGEVKMNTEILDYLNQHRDEKYADFQRKLIPNIPPESIIGVRTPLLRSYAKELSKSDSCGDFLGALPHSFFEENQIHAFVLSEIRDFGRCVELTELFLPYIDNWATCDQLSPKVLGKHTEELLPYIKRWLLSEETYTVRFGLDMLMRFYLEDNFTAEYAEMAAAVRSKEYYVNMAIAWYFATALAKHYDSVLPFISERRLSKWVHNKTIQKAVESFRITDEQKEQLRAMKI